MNRRQFLGAASMLALDPGRSLAQIRPDPDVTRVLAMFKCHLDVGFVDTQANIVRKYFTEFFPAAITTAENMRQAGEDRYTWTTGSWLLYEYLEQAGPAERKRMEGALARNDIAWHALPFTWQTELLEPASIAGGIGFSKSLDRRFGRTTTGAKMTDVPGHTRGLIAPLAENGVAFLDIGVNSASTPPDVPDLFVWRDPRGAELVMMYHRLAYGGVVRVPGTDLAIAVEMADDNYGPHKPEEIRRIYRDLRAQFPNATIHASNLTEIANEVVPHKAAFPVVTQEIGDTWIYGIASDPVKLARFRELQRLRGAWIAQKRMQAGDQTDLSFLSKFLLGAEHTWGTDTKTWLDFDHYTPDALASMLDTPKYKVVTNSWVEKRADLDAAVQTLPSPLRTEANRRLTALKPRRPDVSKLTPRESHEAPLFAISYQTLSKADYDRFLAQYITVQTDWAPKDFGKPNIEKFGAKSETVRPRLVSRWAGDNRAVEQFEFDAPGAPREVWFEYTYARPASPSTLNVSWFGKRANRMPEALWLTVSPPAGDCVLFKTGGTISPKDVVRGGNRHMHAISTGIRCGGMTIRSLDAPLVVLGEMTPIYFSNEQPDPAKGIHFSLFNNGWGTNYVQWFGEDALFRFSIEQA